MVKNKKIQLSQMPKYGARSKKSQRRKSLNVKRSSLINSTDRTKNYDVPAKDLGLIIPAYQNYLYNNESKMVNFAENEMFRGLSFRKKSWVPKTMSFEKEKEFGETYNVNLPDQQYEFVPPESSEQMAFNPIKMYLTAQANYDVAARGGNLPISQYQRPRANVNRQRPQPEVNRSRTLQPRNYAYTGGSSRSRV